MKTITLCWAIVLVVVADAQGQPVIINQPTDQSNYVGRRPHSNPAVVRYFIVMNLLIVLLVLLLLCGGGGFYLGGPVIGGGGIGLVLLICLIVYFMGGFRTKS